MRSLRPAHLLSLILLLAVATASAQTAATSQPPDPNAARLETLSQLLLDTQRQLEQTQRQLNEMRSELDTLRVHSAVSTPAPAASSSSQPDAVAAASLAESVARQKEEQEAIQAEVKQHDQTKLESVSKYPVRVYGLALFNAFSNAGVVDDPDLPSAAITRAPGLSHGSVGASFRQTLLGISATGPRFLSARSSADLSIDFFGGNTYGYYSATNGSVRLRRADIGLAWGASETPGISRDELHLGIDAPLISPLSPTSFATVAEPALAWSGNLWTWAPQLRFKHTLALSSSNPARNLQLEGGLWDPPVVGISNTSASRILSPGEISRRPGVLGRASIHSGSTDRPFAFGIGGFSDRQTFAQAQQIRMWVITGDWQLPITKHLSLDGEIYRGLGLGGLGGGAYKDVLTGVDPVTGAPKTLGLNAVGGWTQLKAVLAPGAEANLIFGQDGAFSRDFRQVDLQYNSYVLEKSARSQMIVANFIYRPRTYLILSPEYRRILSWKITGPAATANIYTISLGYQF